MDADPSLASALYSALRRIKIPDLMKLDSFQFTVDADTGKRTYLKRRSNLVESGKPLHSCVFGLTCSPAWKWDVRPTKLAREHPDVDNLLHEYARVHFPDFRYTTITINRNLQCRRHVDTLNNGPSVLTSVGDFTGGELNIETEDGRQHTFDTKGRFVMYEGARWPHWNNPICGEKFSIVYYKDARVLGHVRGRFKDDSRFSSLQDMRIVSDLMEKPILLQG
tara:strand:+ start:34921 stop:35586 length:666 start_codon:yes stop_codon:yes gene_type:complete